MCTFPQNLENPITGTHFEFGQQPQFSHCTCLQLIHPSTLLTGMLTQATDSKTEMTQQCAKLNNQN